MNVEILPNVDAVAQRAAAFIAGEARSCVSIRGRFVMAVSGGRTPWRMLQLLAAEDVPWGHVHLFQADERVAPEGHADRNLTHLRESLVQRAPLRPDQIYAMPVDLPDLDAATGIYALTLQSVAGRPPVLDLVHLGLGIDGHTASLVPGDCILNVKDRDVALTESYEGRRRMSLTYPILNRSRRVLWVITGIEKAEMFARLFNGDSSIPAGRIRRDTAIVLADLYATGQASNSSTKTAQEVLNRPCRKN